MLRIQLAHNVFIKINLYLSFFLSIFLSFFLSFPFLLSIQYLTLLFSYLIFSSFLYLTNSFSLCVYARVAEWSKAIVSGTILLFEGAGSNPASCILGRKHNENAENCVIVKYIKGIWCCCCHIFFHK